MAGPGIEPGTPTTQVMRSLPKPISTVHTAPTTTL